MSWIWIYLLDPYLLLALLCLVGYFVGGTSLFHQMPVGIAVTWIAIGGLAAGTATGFAAPLRVFPPGPVEGASLLVVPLVLALAMELVGKRDLRVRGQHSCLATWYGGAVSALQLQRAAWRSFATWGRSEFRECSHPRAAVQQGDEPDERRGLVLTPLAGYPQCYPDPGKVR
jgi:hypothetical protein